MGKKTLIISSLLLLLSLILMEFTNVDFIIQDRLYDFQNHKWLLNDPHGNLYKIFYTYIKFPIYLIALWTIYKVYKGFRQKTLFSSTRGYLILLLTLIILPTSIATVGKKSISVQCPYDIPRYGGHTPYVRLLEPYPINPNSKDGKWPPGNCFPAGHASGGFALLGLYLVARTKRERILALIFSLSMGTIMSIYQTMRGSHYLLHHVVTFALALILVSYLNLKIKKEEINESKND